MELSSALFVQKPWIDKILDEEKRWEVRGYLTHKRERFYLAESKANLLRGEATLVDCKLVAVKDGSGDWLIAEDVVMGEDVGSIEKKLGFNFAEVPEILQKCDKLYAWVLRDVKKYEEPIPWKPKSGAVIWSSVNNDKPSKPMTTPTKKPLTTPTKNTKKTTFKKPSTSTSKKPSSRR